MATEDTSAPSPGATSATGDAPAGQRTTALEDPFVITASGERMAIGAAGGALEMRRRGESSSYTLEERDGRTHARAVEGETPALTAASPTPEGSGTAATPDSSGAEQAPLVPGHAVRALDTPMVVTEKGEKIAMDGSRADVEVRRREPGEGASGSLTLGLDGKPIDPADLSAASDPSSSSTSSDATAAPAVRSSAESLAAARRMIMGEQASFSSSAAATPSASTVSTTSGDDSTSTVTPVAVASSASTASASSGDDRTVAPAAVASSASTASGDDRRTSIAPSATTIAVDRAEDEARSVDPDLPIAASHVTTSTSIDPHPPMDGRMGDARAMDGVPVPSLYPPAREDGAAADGIEGAAFTSPLQAGDDAPKDIRSEELDEILTLTPSVLVRWGITAVFATLVTLLAISWFIAYPDVVKGTVVLTTPTPPVRVVSRAAGDVERVFVSDRAAVAAGAPLILLRSPARYADVSALSAALDRLEPSLVSGGPVAAVELDPRLALGDVQPAYASFLQAYSDYRVLADDRFHAEKLASARQQVADHESLRARLAAQQSVQEQQLTLAERARERARQMAAQQLVSPADAEKAEQDYLQSRYTVENGRTALTNNEIQLTSARSALLDLEQRRSDDAQHLLTELRNAHRQLRAAIAGWEQQYLVRAPVAGSVSFFRDLHENQYVSAAEPLVAVVPAGGKLVGRVQLAGAGAGKVAVGQRVIVRLDNYPYREYGVVEGRVQSVSQLGYEQGERNEVTYRAVVELPRGLVSSYGRHLQFRQEMHGDVDVVTEDMRLLERVFNQFRSLKSGD